MVLGKFSSPQVDHDQLPSVIALLYVTRISDTFAASTSAAPACGSDFTTTGGVDIKIDYANSTASANNFVTRVSTSCVADAEDLLAPSYNATSSTTTAGAATAGQRKTQTYTGVAATNCAANELLFVKMERVGGDASDANTGDFRLLGIELTTRRAM